ncbi:hypothetical protein WJX74_006542 [Apatococcus lobatus]|uniref:Uncharacterized protein n=1 Tax=Apatococcus lobatus TaxID=904363 RepID=A0AAW1QU84_9CHLO
MPFIEGKVVRLLEHLYEEAMQPYDAAGVRVPSVGQMLAVRDGLAFSYAWSSTSRSINSRELRLENFTLQSSDMALGTLIYPVMLLPPGTLICITPDHLCKRGPDRNHQEVVLTVPALSHWPAMILSPVTWLRALLMLDAQYSSHVSSLLVRPLVHARSTHFKEVPLGKTSMQDRLDRALIAIGQHEGETLHSFRRGQAVAHRQAGASAEQIQHLLMLTSARLRHT